jgi:hypothetical protein
MGAGGLVISFFALFSIRPGRSKRTVLDTTLTLLRRFSVIRTFFNYLQIKLIAES